MLQKLVMVANLYLMAPQLRRESVPILICLVHCHDRDLGQFLRRWNCPFPHSQFRQRRCPGWPLLPSSPVVLPPLHQIHGFFIQQSGVQR